MDIIRDFHLEELPEAKRRVSICKFVSDPVPDTKVPPAPTTGGATDLTLLDPEGRELPMGCGFDAFTDKTCAAMCISNRVAGIVLCSKYVQTREFRKMNIPVVNLERGGDDDTISVQCIYKILQDEYQ